MAAWRTFVLTMMGLALVIGAAGCQGPGVTGEPGTGPTLTVEPTATDRPPLVQAGLRQRLAAAENRWREQGINSYRITVEASSVWDGYRYQITVRDGEVVEASNTCIYSSLHGRDCPPLEDYKPDEYTVAGIFAWLTEFAENPRHRWLEITFDEQYGYPRTLSYDEEDSIDEEWWQKVTAFEPLQ